MEPGSSALDEMISVYIFLEGVVTWPIQPIIVLGGENFEATRFTLAGYHRISIPDRPGGYSDDWAVPKHCQYCPVRDPDFHDHVALALRGPQAFDVRHRIFRKTLRGLDGGFSTVALRNVCQHLCCLCAFGGSFITDNCYCRRMPGGPCCRTGNGKPYRRL